MAAHKGRDEVERRKKKLSAIFASIDGEGLSPELTSHFARYLCMLISGFAEQSVKELVTEFCRVRSEARIQRYVGAQLKRLRNINQDKLGQLIRSFDPQWWEDLRQRYPDELSAFDSVATLRNNISHGGDAAVTMGTIKQYRDHIATVIDALGDLLDPI